MELTPVAPSFGVRHGRIGSWTICVAPGCVAYPLLAGEITTPHDRVLRGLPALYAARVVGRRPVDPRPLCLASPDVSHTAGALHISSRARKGTEKHTLAPSGDTVSSVALSLTIRRGRSRFKTVELVVVS